MKTGVTVGLDIVILMVPTVFVILTNACFHLEMKLVKVELSLF